MTGQPEQRGRPSPVCLWKMEFGNLQSLICRHTIDSSSRERRMVSSPRFINSKFTASFALFKAARMFSTVAAVLTVATLLSSTGFAQDWIRTGTGLGVDKIRVAVPRFQGGDRKTARIPTCSKRSTRRCGMTWTTPAFLSMVSKSFYPLGLVGSPADVKKARHVERGHRSILPCWPSEIWESPAPM